MPVPIIAFNPSYDIHLLRGQSVDITGLLTLNGLSAKEYTRELNQERTANGAGTIHYAFIPDFKATTKSASRYSGLNIDVDFGNDIMTPDCVIKLHDNDPADANEHIRNFIIKAQATDSKDHLTASTYLRIHVHRFIKEVWISPDIQTIHPAYFEDAFAHFIPSIHARFDDETVAKINQGFQFSGFYIDCKFQPDIGKSVRWDSASKTKGKSFKLNTQTYFDYEAFSRNNAVDEYDIEATFTWKSDTWRAKGAVIVSDQLRQNQTSIVALQVAAGEGPGFARMNDVPNILFLGDGFLEQDRYFFRKLTEDYVDSLMRGRLSSPFGHLSKSINFWRAFIPSRERGVTHRLDVAFGETLLVKEMDQFGEREVEKARVDKTSFHQAFREPASRLRTLHDKFGLATVFEKSKGRAALAAFWKRTKDIPDGEVEAILADTSEEELNRWKSRCHRQRIEEVDTALGLQVNDIAAASRQDDYLSIMLNPNKLTRRDLDAFLSGLKDNLGNPVGQHFVLDAKRGKDYGHIVFVSPILGGREQNTGTYLVAGVSGKKNKEDLFIQETGVDKPFHFYFPLTDRLSLEQKAVLTHELSHSFGLEDEYGNYPTIPGINNKAVTDPLVKPFLFARNIWAASIMDVYANIQTRHDLLTIHPNTQAEELDARKIKWRYHRISHCNVVEKLEVSGSSIVVTISGDTSGYMPEEVVFLRKRTKKTVYFLEGAFEKRLRLDLDDLDELFFVDEPLYLTAESTTTITFKCANDASLTIELPVPNEYDAAFAQSHLFHIRKQEFSPIQDVIRAGPVPVLGAILRHSISPELKIAKAPDSLGTQTLLTLAPVSGSASLPKEMKTLHVEGGKEEMIVYRPVKVPETLRQPDYRYHELISKKILDHLQAIPYPFNTINREEVIDDDPVSNVNFNAPGMPLSVARRKQVIGLYSGGSGYHGHIYHPAAQCMMRVQYLPPKDGEGESGAVLVGLCAVCQYALVNIIDPTQHGKLDQDYMKRHIYLV